MTEVKVHVLVFPDFIKLSQGYSGGASPTFVLQLNPSRREKFKVTERKAVEEPFGDLH